MSRRGYKKGAASFYVVAFSTLILLIIVTSFTALVIAQITRSSNAELSQSAYDSALAGVEDAKLALYDYRSCIANGATAKEPNDDGALNCDEIVYLMENDDSCDKVAFILGRLPYTTDSANAGGEVLIQEESSENGSANNMSQAYTCTKIQTVLKDYRSTLSSSNQMKVIKVKLDDSVAAKDIETMRISWGADLGQAQLNYSNFNDGGVSFAPSGLAPANPPTIAVTLLQSAEQFNLSDYYITNMDEGQTNRGTVFLVPTDNELAATVGGNNNQNKEENYVRSYSNGVNRIEKKAFLKSNDRTYQNKPYGVFCDRQNALSSEFVCSTILELPEPVGGSRSDDNFFVAVMLPYGKPVTDFALEFFCREGVRCGEMTENGEQTNQASLRGMQIGVDSTGRANDLFRRVETRLESSNEGALSLMGPLALFGDDTNDGNSSEVLNKDFSVICEYNFRGDYPLNSRCGN